MTLFATLELGLIGYLRTSCFSEYTHVVPGPALLLVHVYSCFVGHYHDHRLSIICLAGACRMVMASFLPRLMPFLLSRYLRARTLNSDAGAYVYHKA
ncbi:uncharacterized protein BT62DRAFT_456413 [Guyanagaster necrorhizus]|uniref:Uncharacterized protein n=1 Tax=Guyanagaster necrorhizus TaxID=856835 RepID=A0A9P7VJ62_9AGAR|nr:uncharacterized protein BT62DRAFT_456413 [Guyanagaster necrorhizus MCA 3950]KAG7442093.1 hypothetical protein BT62DRAFT_456413 [Guyanagaster necrorhizus MCA 3950]